MGSRLSVSGKEPSIAANLFGGGRSVLQTLGARVSMTMACRRHGARGPRAKRSLLLLDVTTWKLTNPIPTIPSPEGRHRLGPFFLCLVLERFQCNESSVHADGPDSLAKHRD
jgi:hypothetical protein